MRKQPTKMLINTRMWEEIITVHTSSRSTRVALCRRHFHGQLTTQRHYWRIYRGRTHKRTIRQYAKIIPGPEYRWILFRTWLDRNNSHAQIRVKLWTRVRQTFTFARHVTRIGACDVNTLIINAILMLTCKWNNLLHMEKCSREKLDVYSHKCTRISDHRRNALYDPRADFTGTGQL